MRLLILIIGLLILVCLGWNEPFCDTARAIFPFANIQKSRLARVKAGATNAGLPRVPMRMTMPDERPNSRSGYAFPHN